MRVGVLMALWLLVAHTTSQHCREAVCKPAPGASSVTVTVSTFPTPEGCEALRQQMQGTGTMGIEMASQPGLTFRQTTTYTCQKGD
jgi:hypothetical protein